LRNSRFGEVLQGVEENFRAGSRRAWAGVEALRKHIGKNPVGWLRRRGDREAMAIRRFAASVTYHRKDGALHEEEIPVWAEDYRAANRIVLAYVLQVLKLQEFELRIVGA
jgi:hypothetical protein